MSCFRKSSRSRTTPIEYWDNNRAYYGRDGLLLSVSSVFTTAEDITQASIIHQNSSNKRVSFSNTDNNIDHQRKRGRPKDNSEAKNNVKQSTFHKRKNDALHKDQEKKEKLHNREKSNFITAEDIVQSSIIHQNPSNKRVSFSNSDNNIDHHNESPATTSDDKDTHNVEGNDNNIIKRTRGRPKHNSEAKDNVKQSVSQKRKNDALLKDQKKNEKLHNREKQNNESNLITAEDIVQSSIIHQNSSNKQVSFSNSDNNIDHHNESPATTSDDLGQRSEDTRHVEGNDNNLIKRKRGRPKHNSGSLRKLKNVSVNSNDSRDKHEMEITPTSANISNKTMMFHKQRKLKRLSSSHTYKNLFSSPSNCEDERPIEDKSDCEAMEEGDVDKEVDKAQEKNITNEAELINNCQKEGVGDVQQVSSASESLAESGIYDIESDFDEDYILDIDLSVIKPPLEVCDFTKLELQLLQSDPDGDVFAAKAFKERSDIIVLSFTKPQFNYTSKTPKNIGVYLIHGFGSVQYNSKGKKIKKELPKLKLVYLDDVDSITFIKQKYQSINLLMFERNVEVD